MAHGHEALRQEMNLTKNETMVYEAMKATDKPQKAYDLLDILKPKGVRVPMTIYRALEGLEQKGLVHKLDGLNAYVLCNHDEPHRIQTFLVCDECNEVIEVESHIAEAPFVEGDMRTVIAEKGFRMEGARLEIRGHCSNCAVKTV